jgi:hypothetical protein
MRQLLFAALLVGLVGAPARAEATQVSLELRHTPMHVRPNDTPSLCGLVSLSLTEHWWAGVGYELAQDYDAILWTSETEGHKPILMSGIRAGAWYRGGAAQHGMAWAVGGLFTFANSAFSVAPLSKGLDSGTSVVDFGADFTFGHVWETFRIELFATPAWSYGQVSSKAIHKDETYRAFTYRVGGALVLLLGS